ncbi:hypothetical protein NQ314_008585 [Rhamnusium bicolor]|uniref:Uncharacterized protein n=1 Tax=Rhamnusium bicolor TaxID=1586634 RepID=A0AAV8Y9G2_9CUCU|nr:hypothetical protein NQ314_008585 [Rhamnusium bicolor]
MFIFKQVNCLLINTNRDSAHLLLQLRRNFTIKPATSRANLSIPSKFVNSNFYQTCATLQTAKKNLVSGAVSTHNTISSIQIKKRIVRKKKTFDEEGMKPGNYNVVAFVTAEEYDFKRLLEGLKQQDLYEPQTIENNSEVIHAVAKYHIGTEPREIFFFKEGRV